MFMKKYLLFFILALFSCNFIFANEEWEQEKLPWTIWGEFLYWKASEQGLDYAVNVAFSSASQPIKMDWEKPHFEWSPGFRLGAGKRICISAWDLSITWTHFFTHAHSTTSSGNGSHFMEQLWIPSPYGIDANHSSMKWGLHYNTVDLLMGYNCDISECFSITPFFGLRGLFIDQDIHVKYNGGDFDPIIPIKFRGKNDYNAFGIRVGVDLFFWFNQQVNIFGSGSTTLLYGKYILAEKVSGKNVLLNQVSKNLFHENSNFFQVTNDLATAVGVEWRPCIFERKVSIAFAYEIIKVFGQNQLRRYRNQEPENRLNGNLGIQGVTVLIGLQI